MGSAIHEHATCRMGDDPKRSALNKFNQMHDVKNVFVTDGSSFTTASEKNPTLTILALSWRATDYLADEIKKHVRERHSAYAYPRRIEFVDDLPKTLTGKIRRVELREREFQNR